MTDFLADALGRYREAVARRDAIKVEWEARESPLLAAGSTGQLVEHPLVKMLREHDILVDKLARELRQRHRGPDPKAVVQASIGKAPSAEKRRLRVAK